VAGGSTDGYSCFASAELYHPSTGKWTSTGSMTQPRCHHSATLLPNGEVLVAGGADSLDNSPDTTDTAELYNPTTGTWQTAGSLKTSRASQVALLENGQVLVAGGYNTSNGTTTGLASAQPYDLSTGSWSPTASMRLALYSPTTPALLPNNDVLIGDDVQFYNPGTGTWINTGPLPKIARPPTQASPLPNGNALASGTLCSYSGCGLKLAVLLLSVHDLHQHVVPYRQHELAAVRPQLNPASQRAGAGRRGFFTTTVSRRALPNSVRRSGVCVRHSGA
jgi:hypothetical protein